MQWRLGPGGLPSAAAAVAAAARKSRNPKSWASARVQRIIVAFMEGKLNVNGMKFNVPGPQ